MAQQPLELILLRQLTECLALPMFVVDASGEVVLHNAAAEKFYGVQPEEVPRRRAFRELAPTVDPRDQGGRPIPVERLPVTVALETRRPQQAQVWVEDRARTRHHILTTAMPLRGHDGKMLGVLVVFWESPPG